MRLLYFLLCIIALLIIFALIWKVFGAESEKEKRKLFIITTATILSCEDSQTNCKTLATDSVKKELKELPRPYENLVEQV